MVLGLRSGVGGGGRCGTGFSGYVLLADLSRLNLALVGR